MQIYTNKMSIFWNYTIIEQAFFQTDSIIFLRSNILTIEIVEVNLAQSNPAK
jgi:hypothetical protein